MSILSLNLLKCVSAITLLSIVGCGPYPIEYDVPERDMKSGKTHPANVLVTTLTDVRPPEERIGSLRASGDYTSDFEFDGQVSEEISKMVAKHLSAAGVFARVRYVNLSISDLDAIGLDSLGARGFHAILMGQIEHFSGYYETNVGREFLCVLGFGCLLGIPPLFLDLDGRKSDNSPGSNLYYSGIGLVLGSGIANLVERSFPRDLGRWCTLSMQLINTSTHQVVWKDSVTVHENEHRAASGENKFGLANAALRDAVSRLTSNMRSDSLDFMKPQ